MIPFLVFAEGAKVNEGNKKGCKGLGLAKTIGIYLADTTASKQFTKQATWQNKVMYLEKDPRLTRSDIDYMSIPAATTAEKSFSLVFTKAGYKRISKATNDNFNKYLVIMVEDQMVLSSQIKTNVGQEVQVTDGTQTDGIPLFNKMCPNPNIF